MGSATFSVWIRRGDDAFSEDPDTNENLVVEYLNSAGNWITLETFLGGDTPGQIYTPSYALPSDALHAGFRIRFKQVGPATAGFDFWHIDDVKVSGRQTLATFFNTKGSGTYTLRFHLYIKLHGGLRDKEYIKFWVDDVRIIFQ